MGSKDRIFYPNQVYEFGGKSLDLSAPTVMGILNVTPDSFYAGSRTDESTVIERAAAMIQAGANILDIGGYSSRPGASHIDEQEELDRVLPAVKLVARNFPNAIISVDTFRSSVAARAIDLGAFMINDISGGNLDQEMFTLVSSQNVPYVLMHMQGTPQTMQTEPAYDDVVEEVVGELFTKAIKLTNDGANQLILDPGFGFGKTLQHNFALLNQLHKTVKIGYPVLTGFSRKSMISRFLGISASESLNGTSILNTLALEKGSKILRVHDVREAIQCVKLWSAATTPGA